MSTEKVTTREEITKEFEDFFPDIVRRHFIAAMNGEAGFWLGQRFGVQYYAATDERSLAHLLDEIAVAAGNWMFETREELDKLKDREDTDLEEEIKHLKQKLEEKDAENVQLMQRVADFEKAVLSRDPLAELPKKRGRKPKANGVALSEPLVKALDTILAPGFPPPPPPPPAAEMIYYLSTDPVHPCQMWKSNDGPLPHAALQPVPYEQWAAKLFPPPPPPPPFVG